MLPILQLAPGMQALFQSVTRCIVLPSLADVCYITEEDVVDVAHFFDTDFDDNVLE